MPQSSAAGVATIRTTHHTVVATYDATDNTLKEFFAHLQEALAHDIDVHTVRSRFTMSTSHDFE
jgi:tyrosine-protein phosphatase YwqE